MKNLAAIGVLCVIFGVACGSGGDGSAPSAPPPAETPTATEPAATPAPAAEAPSETASAPDATRGEALYQTYCASCHGPKGDGDGPVAAGLTPPPAKHSDAAYMNALDDEYLFRVIQQGGAAVGKSPLMAPWGGALDDSQIRDLVAYIRTLAH